MEQKKVQLILKSRHCVEDPDITREVVVNAFGEIEWESDTEEFLVDWDNDEYDDADDESADEIDGGETLHYPGKLSQERQNRMETMMNVLFDMKDSVGEEEDEYYVLTCEAVMTRKVEDGSEILEITYEENPTLDNTTTTLRFDSAHPDSVVIMRSGGLVNTIVCEKGVVHESYFRPFAVVPYPIQMSVYTRLFEGSMSFENGGSVEMDYMTAMHGLDRQRTTMKITVAVE